MVGESALMVANFSFDLNVTEDMGKRGAGGGIINTELRV